MHIIFGEREQAHNDCICTSHPRVAYLQLALWNHKRYSFDQALKSAANAPEWTRVLWLARSHIVGVGSV